MSFQNTIVNLGPDRWWRLEETEGTTLEGETLDTPDLTLVSTPIGLDVSTGIDGLGSAAEANSSGSAITQSPDSDFAPFPEVTVVLISAGYVPSGTNTVKTIFHWGNNSAGAVDSVILITEGGFNNSDIGFAIKTIDGSSSGASIKSSVSADPTVWFFEWDGSTGRIFNSIDGASVTQRSSASMPLSLDPEDRHAWGFLGRDISARAAESGIWDEPMVFRRVLTSAEKQEIVDAVFDPPEPGEIAGIVRNADTNNIIEGASVFVKSASSGNLVASTETDASGEYAFLEITPGTYHVFAYDTEDNLVDAQLNVEVV